MLIQLSTCYSMIVDLLLYHALLFVAADAGVVT